MKFTIVNFSVVMLSASALTCIQGGCKPGGESSPEVVNRKQDVSSLSPMELAQAAAGRGDMLTASEMVQKALVVEPNDPVVLEFAGDLAAARQETDSSIEFYESAVKHSQSPSRELLDKLGRTQMAAGRPFLALDALRKAVELYPKEPAIRTDLAGLLASLGLETEAAPHLRWLVMRGHGGMNELTMLSDITRPQTDSAISDYAMKRSPEDPRPLYALARDDAYKGKWEAAAEKLKRVIDKHPDFIQAQAYYSRAIVEQNDQDAIAAWSTQIPPGIESQAQYWIAAGAWAERNGQTKEAARAYWQAALLEPDNGESLNRLATILARLGLNEPSRLVAVRAGQLAKARDMVDTMQSRGKNSQDTAVEIAKLMDSLGRPWEAAAWLRLGATMNRDMNESLADVYADIRSRLDARTPWLMPKAEVAKELDFSDWPLHQWKMTRSIAADPLAATTRHRLRLTDQAPLRQLDHICKIAPLTRGEAGLWIYQSGAGGAASIDYDLDGWPDLYLTNMDGVPKERNSSPNNLYRNQGGTFARVTDASRAGDTGFAQGIAVSDYNMDGFDDLYIANIGRNRLLRNNGDGTFTDVTEGSGLVGDDWTSSVAMVDIDQDGYVDLFEVGYCAGEEVLSVPCLEEGEIFACLPKSFPAQKDRVWQGQVDGRFVEVTDQWIADQEPAHGLGIVAGFFDELTGLDLYVANDMSANHFWSSHTDEQDAFQLRDQASLRGLAVDRRSLSQASMGIAAGDADQDGDVDFYLTHFSQEYNTLYEQVTTGIWADVSQQVGLAAPSMDMLAFGTQFLDIDSNGTQELIVANGHLNDYTIRGQAYRMPTQVFERGGDGAWSLRSNEELGEYFTTKRLSRSLITLDANRDGKVDALITHLFDPVSLLVNESEGTGKSVTLFLKSVTGHPDAIGAQVTMKVGDKTLNTQLIGGNGYQCANQRMLHVGLGEAEKVDAITVQWPWGALEEFPPVATGREYLLIEGSGEAFELGR
jgi:Flp pilus assembly protein TadD